MNTKVRNALLTFLVVILLLFGFLEVREFWLKIGEPVDQKPPDPLREELSTLISLYEDDKISIIDLSTITDFSWDRLYVFGPYTQANEIKSVVGTSLGTTCDTDIASLENSVLLLFTSNGRVVYCFDYHMGENNFDSLYKHTLGFSIEEAQFIVGETGEIIWIGDK